MRAAIFRKGEIVVDTLPEPKPEAGQVLVKTLACGICGSDLHARLHAPKMAALAARIPGREPMDVSRDIVFGHEYCCEILDHGPGSQRTHKVGTHVCSVPRLMSGAAIGGIGYSNANVGGYAERMLLSEPLLVPVPNGLSPVRAALTEPLAVGVHAVEKARLDGDEVPLVIGCGPVGLAVIAALKLKRAQFPKLGPIIAADFSPKRRELAIKMGADVAVDPAKTSPYATWTDHAKLPPPKDSGPGLTAGLIDMKAPFKQALIFECVGVPGMIQKIFESAPRDARVVVVGVCMETDGQEPMLAIFKELNLQYVLAYTPAEFVRSLHILAEGLVDADALVTGKVGLDGVKAAFTELASPEAHTKIMVEPWR
jgi:threonine dehydrogenase-like Zn-dependent dehydrogenase